MRNDASHQKTTSVGADRLSDHKIDLAASRPRAIYAAIRKLRTKSGAPPDPGAVTHAVLILDWMLAQYALAAKAPVATAKLAAQQIGAVLTAWEAFLVAVEALNDTALEAINRAKSRRRLVWAPEHSTWTVLHHELPRTPDRRYSGAFAELFPDFVDVLFDARGDLAGRKISNRPKDTGNRYLRALAFMSADFYVMLTARTLRPGRGLGRFAQFLERIFAAGEIEGSVEHYANVGAKILTQKLKAARSGSPPPEISWYLSQDRD